MTIENEACPKCNNKAQTRKNGNHLELYCEHCGHIRFVKQPIENFIMPFGKHKGQKIVDLPIDYLQWCLENFKGGMKKNVEAAFKYNFAKINNEN